MRIITTEKIPIKMWLDDIEDGAIEQAKNLANLPFLFKHVAIMPDAHQGYGMPIGGVIAANEVVIPNAVGVDIGCGMCAMKTELTEISYENLLEIVNKIKKYIPVGFAHHQKPQENKIFENYPDVKIIHQEIEKAKYQLGTLGGGNHFIEIQKGSDGFVWVMIHSGSRNFGLQIAKVYHEKAKEMCLKYHANITTHDLAFLPIGEKDCEDYLKAMNYALDFAKGNRYQMMQTIKHILNTFAHTELNYDEIINIYHNYARYENHFGKNVMIHRKGATSARDGEIGIIPGSQGTRSYIVKGKGNVEGFMSCSHGAGRKMGRKEAQMTLNIDTEKELLNSQRIVHGMTEIEDLDEAPGAYKDISEVMKNQKDLVDIMVELSPLAVVKG
uniref:3'-phosphate/5'-hydroxy nucleic acid ligase n=1 Tax=viral metagenome TaxID=1070528 RepID=A0A6M3M4S6_9ZZZZ